MFDGILDICSINGILIGIPSNIFIPVWKVNKELLQKIDLKLPENNWTWDDFYEFAKQSRCDLDGDGIYDSYALRSTKGLLLSTMLLPSYDAIYLDIIHEKISFNNNDFIHLINLWKNFYEEKLILDEGTPNMPFDDRILLYQPFSFSLYEGDNCLIHPPVLKSKRVYPANAIVYCVNRKSRHMNLCIEYLSVYLSKEVQLSGPSILPALYKDTSLYPEGEQRQGLLLSNQLNMNIYMDIIKNSVPIQALPEEFNQFRLATLESFFKNEISAEEAAKLINDKTKMILDE
jgi:hypothetical protein